MPKEERKEPTIKYAKKTLPVKVMTKHFTYTYEGSDNEDWDEERHDIMIPLYNIQKFFPHIKIYDFLGRSEEPTQKRLKEVDEIRVIYNNGNRGGHGYSKDYKVKDGHIPVSCLIELMMTAEKDYSEADTKSEIRYTLGIR
jgi:hypothetical protein